MIRLFEWLFYGHCHEWEIISKGELIGREGGRGVRFILRCKKCGNVKKKDLI